MRPLNYYRVLRFLPRLIYKESSLPLYFVFFITHRCVANCGHCFNWPLRNQIKASDELTIDEIEKVSRSMGPMIFMFLTGGEPFIRNDVAEIAKIFYKNNQIVKYQIPSNGYFTENTVKQMEEIARSCPLNHASVTVSIDGIGEDHDKIRGLKGLFDRAAMTIKELKRLSEIYPNLGVNAEITVSAYNQDKLVDTFHYVTDKLKVANVLTPLVRGVPRDPESKKFSVDNYEKFVEDVYIKNSRSKKFGYGGFVFARFVTYKDILSRRIVADITRNQRPIVPCMAGRVYGILYANGDVEFCEITRRHVGNVRNCNYDFKKVWLSQRAKELKDQILKSRCFCTHECPLTASVFSNPRFLGKLVSEKIKDDIMIAARKWLKSGKS